MASGDYLVVAKLDGFPYDSGTGAPGEHPISVAAGAETVQDIAFPDTARLRVRVVDGSGAAMPAKVSVVGVDPAPEPAGAFGTVVFRSDIDQQGRLMHGIAAVRFLDQSGDSGAFPRSAAATAAVQTYLAAAAKPAESRHRACLDALIAALPSPQVGGDALIALAAVPSLARDGHVAVPTLAGLLHDADRRISAKAAMALAAVGGSAALAALSGTFAGGAYDTQVAAVFALRGIGSNDALRILREIRAAPPDPRLGKVIDLALGLNTHGH
jgi:hypothetical protein